VEASHAGFHFQFHQLYFPFQTQVRDNQVYIPFPDQIASRRKPDLIQFERIEEHKEVM
jgi:hypothetical protein